MYIFKYHPDNTIYRNGKCVSSYSDFMAANPDFPMVEGEFFEYREGGFDLINLQGNHFPQEPSASLVDAINGLEEL